jgi:hypothetical protein
MQWKSLLEMVKSAVFGIASSHALASYWEMPGPAGGISKGADL